MARIRSTAPTAAQNGHAEDAQAVIARLEAENQRLRDTQTATASVLRVIATASAESQRVLEALTESAGRLLGATNVRLWMADGDRMRAVTAFGTWGAEITPSGGTTELTRAQVAGKAILDNCTVHIEDIRADDAASFSLARARTAGTGLRTVLSTPLRRRGTPIGALSVWRSQVQPFTADEIALLESFADQAVIAIENARLLAELEERTHTLEEALEQQTATSDILRAISTAPNDLQPVLDAVLSGAARLCEARDAVLFRADGTGMRIVASFGAFAESLAGLAEHVEGSRRIPLEPRSVSSATILERRSFHVRDLLQEIETFPGSRFYAEQGGLRTVLTMPLVREHDALGAFALYRDAVRPFSDRQSKLLQTFADQAVIAIENARLFSELQERDQRRARELERASGIQQRLLPTEVQGWPGLLEMAVRFRPAVETSGDFYDVLRLAPATEGGLPPLQIAVGDVAGKGMSAALVTALARSALRFTSSLPTAMATPANTLRLAGQRLHADVGAGHFVACAVALVEPADALHRLPRLRLSNAAQVPVLLCRGGAATEIIPPGDRLPLGVRPDGDYEDARVELRPGDVVVFASDGLPEAPGSAGELFGFERLAQSAARWSATAGGAEAVAEWIWSDVTAWCGDESHHDDMTLLVLRVPKG